MPPRLSICIPTHNGRRAELQHLLGTILSQLTPSDQARVEIVISDNASSDGTEEMVRAAAADHSRSLAYHRNHRDIGGTANIFRSVDLAAGEYCWVVGSDDGLEPRALETVLHTLQANGR